MRREPFIFERRKENVMIIDDKEVDTISVRKITLEEKEEIPDMDVCFYLMYYDTEGKPIRDTEMNLPEMVAMLTSLVEEPFK